jgi:hypothetical protein
LGVSFFEEGVEIIKKEFFWEMRMKNFISMIEERSREFPGIHHKERFFQVYILMRLFYETGSPQFYSVLESFIN